MVKRLFKNIVHAFGVDLVRYRKVVLPQYDYVRNEEMINGLIRCKERGLKLKTIIDVGAAEGSWSLSAREIWPDAQYLLFEPLEERKEALDELASKYKNFRIVNAGAGKEKSQKSFHVSGDLDGSAVVDSPSDGELLRTIDITSIDDEVQSAGLPGPFVIKLDTHGFEVPILEGASETLKSAELVIIEVYGFHLTKESLLFFELTTLMDKLGFRMADLVDVMRRKKMVLSGRPMHSTCGKTIRFSKTIFMLSLTDYPKISIVTPSFNHGNFLEQTILSVVGQGYPNLEYIIIDGGSTDNTKEIITKYEHHLAYWISEKDNGLYDALNKGFAKSTGELMGWINADDILHQRSLFVIGEIFAANPGVNWLQGYPTVVDETGRVVYHRPARSNKYEFYQKRYHDGIFIQQESTYWRRTLWNDAGACLSTRCKYAGDFELWMRFFQHAELFVTQALIGAFRVHGSTQISAVNYTAYIKECDDVVEACLSGLPKKERAAIAQLDLFTRWKQKLPRIFGALLMRRFTGQQLNQKEVSYDFSRQQFLVKQ